MLENIKRLLLRMGLWRAGCKPCKEGKIIECFDEKMTWGHNIYFADFEDRKIVGWMTPLPEVGDELRFEWDGEKIARFRIIKMEPCGHPRNMFFAYVENLGYLEV